MGIRIEVTQPDGGTEVHEGDEDTTPEADEGEQDAAAQGAPDTPDPSPQADAPAAAAPDTEPDEVVISIGDETPPADDGERAPEWVRELRKQHRELQKRVREYEAREQAAPAGPKPVGPKPKLEDHDYDTDRYETALEAWYAQKAAADKAEREAQRQAEEAQKAWQAKLDGYGKAKADLKVRDYDEAEHTVMETLNVTQQGVVLQGAENPALVVYALGKNPRRAKELAAITDPVRFAFAVAKLEAQLKVTPRTKPPAPERSLPVGTAPVSGGSDSTLERLREEAARTGDMTKVVAYKRQLAAKAGARA
jgi:hypothetical protein